METKTFDEVIANRAPLEEPPSTQTTAAKTRTGRKTQNQIVADSKTLRIGVAVTMETKTFDEVIANRAPLEEPPSTQTTAAKTRTGRKTQNQIVADSKTLRIGVAVTMETKTFDEVIANRAPLEEPPSTQTTAAKTRTGRKTQNQIVADSKTLRIGVAVTMETKTFDEVIANRAPLEEPPSTQTTAAKTRTGRKTQNQIVADSKTLRVTDRRRCDDGDENL
ncbi:hypothetical protein DEO72_LG5g2549 [Vigna unguiculata]|uniref:Uncharacterized protein n=1 Tax=Vigna unguiculata TaxID=3917 RepID=A0A4D6M075_VIGUN|nr:hypothetical protein DEO72_LG5g2549 [Vigna unguiculata]